MAFNRRSASRFGSDAPPLNAGLGPGSYSGARETRTRRGAYRMTDPDLGAA